MPAEASKPGRRARLAAGLRWAGYAIAIAGLTAVYWMTLGPGAHHGAAAGGSVAAMGQMGNGVGDALVLLFIMLLAALSCAFANGLAFWLSPAPTSRARKFELSLFLLPALVILWFALAFAFNWN